MGRQVKDFTEIKNERSERLEDAAGLDCDAGYGAAYRQARANVLEASVRGLVRLRVA